MSEIGRGEAYAWGGAGNIAAVKDRCVCADETRAEIEGGEQ